MKYLGNYETYEKELYTKKDYENLLLTLINPLKPYYSPEKARLQLGTTFAHYDKNAAWMEGFSRPLWGLVPFFAGGGEDKDFLHICQSGLKAGTNKENEEYWGECSPFNQRFVEMAAIAYGIMFAPNVFWEPLSEEEKDNLEKYLNKINQYTLPVCNWILFAILVNISMKKVGRNYNPQLLEQYLQGVEEFYLGEGWYQDGDSKQKDYYVSFAIHFYCLIYSKVMEKEDKVRSIRYKERAMEFAKDFIYWFDEDGAAIPYGRSLTYRFSQVSFFTACLIADIQPFSIGIMKGLIGRHLRNWMSKPIFDRDGVLSIGYGYPNFSMAERYNAPGSPYWGLKTFGILILEENHPYWSAEEEPYPLLPTNRPMKPADMWIKKYINHTTAYTPGVYSPFGHGQIVAKYGKFAYDTKFSISIAKSNYELHENAPDSMLAFFIDGYVYVRRICIESSIEKDYIYSKWSPIQGIEVETYITPTEQGHERIHRIKSEIQCVAYDCGFCVDRGGFDEVDYGHKEEGSKSTAYNKYSICSVEGKLYSYKESKEEKEQVLYKKAKKEGEVHGKEDAHLSKYNQYREYVNTHHINGLYGQDGVGTIILPDPNTNLLYQRTGLPSVKYQIEKGEKIIVSIISSQYFGK